MRALFLAAAIALPAFGRAERPLWTAGILSDSHVGRTRESCDLVAKACRLFAEHDVDLFVNCGDIADRHYPEAYPILREISDTAFPRKPAKKIWVYAYHEWIDRLKEPWQAVMADVKRMLGAENDLFEAIDFKGFPLIVLPQWWNGTEADRAKVTAMLDDASARHPTGPIFVFDHVPGTGTTENSQTWGNGWQGEYTTVNATGRPHASPCRSSTPTGSSGRMRYLIEFAQRDASYRYYFLVREGGKGRIRFNHVKIEKLQDRGRAEGGFLTKENTTDESQHSIVPGRLFAGYGERLAGLRPVRKGGLAVALRRRADWFARGCSGA